MTRHRVVRIAAAVLMTAASLHAASTLDRAATFRVSATYTNVSFTIVKWMVLKQEGIFRDFSGAIYYDPRDPARSRVQFTVQVASIDTRNSTRDRVLRSDDFFDASRYPTMTFVSTAVAPSGANALAVTGDLTIRGMTRQVTIPVTFLGYNEVPNGGGNLAGFEAAFTLDRTQFGVNGFRWSGGKLSLSKEVGVHLLVGAIRED